MEYISSFSEEKRALTGLKKYKFNFYPTNFFNTIEAL